MPEPHLGCSIMGNNRNMYQLSTISVLGEDAFNFLQGQLSNDLAQLENKATIRAAWCTPKGRVITLMSVTKTDEGYSLVVPAELSESLIKRLTLFRFRAKVDFSAAPAATGLDPVELIDRGVPWIGVAQSEKFTPHMLNLDRLDAISLDKGCYTGQEIVARTHYKGATKRRMLKFESSQPVAPGDKISNGAREVGEVLNAAENKLLAIVPVENANDELVVDGAALVAQVLPYPLR